MELHQSVQLVPLDQLVILSLMTMLVKPLLSTAVYVIYYGAWTPRQKTIIRNFVGNIGITPWWAINRAYGVSYIIYRGTIDDNYSQGKALTGNGVWMVVYNALTKGLLPKDNNGIYLVLTSA